MSTATTKLMTADEFEAQYLGKRAELVRGIVIEMPPAGGEHGGVAMDLGTILNNFVKARGMGRVYGAETGFRIGSDNTTVRAPDVAFIRKDRLAGALVRGYVPVVPDMVAEVISPSDLWSDVDDKVQQWLDAGVTSVWVVDPPHRTLSIFRRDEKIRFSGSDEVQDEAALPGLVFVLPEIFTSAL